MTAAIAGAAAEGAGASAAGAGEAGAVSRVAPTASGPTGTAGAGAGASGAKARTKAHFAQQPKTMPTGGAATPKPATKPAGGRSGGGGVTTGKTTTTRSGKTTSTNTTKRSAFPAFFGGGKGKGGGWVGSGSGQRMLVAEFIACSLILALSPLTDKHRSDTAGQWMKRATSICALFVVLGLVGTAGPRSAKVAASFGGLVTLVLLLTDRDVLVVIADRLGAPAGTGPRGPGSATDSPAGPPDPGLTPGPILRGPGDSSGSLGIPPNPSSGSSFWDWLSGGLGPI